MVNRPSTPQFHRGTVYTRRAVLRRLSIDYHTPEGVMTAVIGPDRGRGLAIVAAIVSMLMALPSATTAAAQSSTTPQRAGFSPGYAINHVSDRQLAGDLDDMKATGARWLRVDVDWSIVEQERGKRDWSVPDRVVTAAVARGFKMILVAAYTPTWARPLGTTDKWAPDPALFADFAGAVARRYARKGIHTFQVWNEPNIQGFWHPLPEPAVYTVLLKKAYAAIRAADSRAKVLAAGLSPAADDLLRTGIAPETFLERMYDAGARGYFTAVAMHPYSFPDQPMDPRPWNPFYNLPRLRAIMVAHGDSAKKIWGTEYGAPTGRWLTAATESTQAQMVTAAYDAWNKWSWTGPLLWYSNRDSGANVLDAEQNFGLIRHDGSRKPGYAAFVRAVRVAAPRTVYHRCRSCRPSARSRCRGCRAAQRGR